MDRPQTAKTIADIVNQMDTQPLAWYVESIERLSQLLQTDYDNAHRLILSMRNQH